MSRTHRACTLARIRAGAAPPHAAAAVLRWSRDAMTAGGKALSAPGFPRGRHGARARNARGPSRSQDRGAGDERAPHLRRRPDRRARRADAAGAPLDVQAAPRPSATASATRRTCRAIASSSASRASCATVHDAPRRHRAAARRTRPRPRRTRARRPPRGACKRLDYADVATVEGGVAAWRRAGLPVVCGIDVEQRGTATAASNGEAQHRRLEHPPHEGRSASASKAIAERGDQEERHEACIPGAVSVDGFDIGIAGRRGFAVESDHDRSSTPAVARAPSSPRER